MLQMVNFDDKDLSPVLNHADQAKRQFNTWAEERNAGLDSDDSSKAFFNAAKFFLGLKFMRLSNRELN